MNSMNPVDKDINKCDRAIKNEDKDQSFYELSYARLCDHIECLNLEKPKHDDLWDYIVEFASAYHAKETERNLKPELERQFKWMIGRI